MDFSGNWVSRQIILNTRIFLVNENTHSLPIVSLFTRACTHTRVHTDSYAHTHTHSQTHQHEHAIFTPLIVTIPTGVRRTYILFVYSEFKLLIS